MSTQQNSIDAAFSVSWTHKLRFTNSPFEKNGVLDSLLSDIDPTQLLVVVDQGLAIANQGYMHKLNDWCKRTSTVQSKPVLVLGGEESKNNVSVVSQILEIINANDICRKSCILIIGGGAVLDSVGFAASIAHRGIPIIRMPSTTLAQGDSGVGVKNGINYFGKKNFIGVFTPPYAVVNDVSLLSTLDDKHWRSGISEAIKVALVKDRTLFSFIESNAKKLLQRDTETMAAVLQQSVQLHLHHIADGGDPFERNAARPLDFGHWSAHKLEQLTNYELTHGDAVAIGLALDLLISVELGYLNTDIANRVISLLQQIGFPTNHPELQNPDLLSGIEEFRQHLGGQLTLIMLRDIEKPIDIHELDHTLVRQVIDKLM